MQNGFAHPGGEVEGIETDIRTITSVTLDERAFGKARAKQQTERRLTSSAVTAISDVRSIRQI
jgi:hypothetical protein